MAFSKGKGKGVNDVRQQVGKGSDGFWTLWVGNLPQGYTAETFARLFARHGGGKMKKNFLGGSCGQGMGARGGGVKRKEKSQGGS